ncbi:phage terminase large subunit family protein [Chitiniphilus eburneus]|uniref:phage terminase large subunit family protein n=1 Tax=Chitiniphilus eburneus TaxID=2571148 RepID=UPI0035D06E49
MIQFADGAATYRAAYYKGLRPDPEVWVDQWADEFMRIPRDAGAAEPGPYRTERTPYAREPMRCLSPTHPAKRVVTMVASQLMKTQIALNWIGACMHMAPANILALLPSLSLAKRVSGRIGKTIDATPVLKQRVAPPRSRDARNTMDTKEFSGGTLYVTTAGSAANLAELSARYIYGDEVDRWEASVNGEGDPVELAETRASTFGRHAKLYFSSSPTVKGASRIADLYADSDQRHYYVPCPHCDHMQTLEWEHLRWDDEYHHAFYLCGECGKAIEEHHKSRMLAQGEWRAHADGDGETVGFYLNGLYSPSGWLSWLSMAKQFDKAKRAQDRGDPEPMQVFYNTRLARVWDVAEGQAQASELQARAEDYRLGTIPAGVLVLTASVDTQHNRLELLIIGWGVGMERWVVDHQVIMGDPASDTTWAALEERLTATYAHPSGQVLGIAATAIDSGGHHTDEVYQFTRLRRWRNVLAVKGASKPNKPVIAQRASKVDVTWRGVTEKHGAELWIIGTDTAKDWLYNRYALVDGPGAIHFSTDLPDEFYRQATAERKLTRYVKGFPRHEWVKPRAERNEALDLLVYNLAMAQYLGLHRYRETDWQRLQLRFAQQGLFEPPPAQADPAPDPAPAGSVVSNPIPTPTAAPQRRASSSNYLNRRR